MDKITYLAELAEGLARWVPERERQDILRYYAEYFEEAGFEREAEVVAELGDPWALSCRLAVEGGYVTQEQAMAWRPRKRWPKVLIGIAAGLSVFALVSSIGLLAFNVMRIGRGFAQNTVVDIASEAAPYVFEEFVDPIEGYGGAVADIQEGTGYSIVGACLIDGGSVEVFDSIDADISLGNIKVVAGDDYTLSVTRSDSLTGYEPTWEVRDGVLRLWDGRSQQAQVNSWDDLKSLFGAGRLAVDVTITVPEGAVLGRVSVKTGLGNVTLWGLNAETVAAETGLGNVECYNARNVRKLDLSTGMGDVNLGMEEVRSGLSISLESGMGNVEANLRGSETDYSYTLGSGMGAVTVDGGYMGGKAVKKGNTPYNLTAESGMGDVSVYFFN